MARQVRANTNQLGNCCGSHLEFDPVDNPHLLEEGGLATLPGPEEQQLDLPAEGLPILLQHAIYFLALVPLLDLLGAKLEPQATSTRPRQGPRHLATRCSSSWTLNNNAKLAHTARDCTAQPVLSRPSSTGHFAWHD